ncbi:hypothetical protein ACISK3_13185 [Morganella morganii]
MVTLTRQQENSARMRQVFVISAHGFFIEKGYQSVLVDEIARNARLQKGRFITTLKAESTVMKYSCRKSVPFLRILNHRVLFISSRKSGPGLIRAIKRASATAKKVIIMIIRYRNKVRKKTYHRTGDCPAEILSGCA